MPKIMIIILMSYHKIQRNTAERYIDSKERCRERDIWKRKHGIGRDIEAYGLIFRGELDIRPGRISGYGLPDIW